MPVNKKQLAQRLSTSLASFKLPATAINQIADRILVEGLDIGRFNPCIYGICIDYIRTGLLANLSKAAAEKVAYRNAQEWFGLQ